MPLYEYRCEKCGKLFEVRQKFADEPLRMHEECGGPAERLISAPSLQFKGSGFYVNDYAKGSNGGGASNKSESSERKDSGTNSKEKKDSGSNSKESSSKDSGSTSSTAPAEKSSSSSSDTKGS